MLVLQIKIEIEYGISIHVFAESVEHVVLGNTTHTVGSSLVASCIHMSCEL